MCADTVPLDDSFRHRDTAPIADHYYGCCHAEPDDAPDRSATAANCRPDATRRGWRRRLADGHQVAACVNSAVFASGLSATLANYVKFQSGVANFIFDNLLTEEIIQLIPVIGEVQDAVLAAIEICAPVFTLGITAAQLIGFVNDFNQCINGSKSGSLGIRDPRRRYHVSAGCYALQP